MLERPWKILLIGSSGGDAAPLKRALLAGLPAGATIIESTADSAVDQGLLDDGEADLLFVDLDALGACGIATIAELRQKAPFVPLVALARSGEETQAIAALQAGAQDCLGAAESQGILLIRAVRYAIERSRFQVQLDEAREQDVRNREIGGLSLLSGPTPLPITERSLGSASLSQRAPEDFEDIVRHYGELLDRALLGRSVEENEGLADDISTLAEKLGMLGAGPRDTVDLHKAAMSARLEGQSARKNKAYIEEGRLLLVQLMGHLVSFYRRLSWGRAPASRSRHDGHERRPVSPAAAMERKRQ